MHTAGAVGYKTFGQCMEDAALFSPVESLSPPLRLLPAHSLSKAKIVFQSFFMLMTVQPFFFASS